MSTKRVIIQGVVSATSRPLLQPATFFYGREKEKEQAKQFKDRESKNYITKEDYKERQQQL